MTDPAQRLHGDHAVDLDAVLPRRPAVLRALLDRADVAADEWLRGAATTIVGAASSLVGLVIGAPAIVIAVAFVATLLPVGLLLRHRDRRERRAIADVPIVLDAVARNLRSGGTPRRAVAETAARVHSPLAPRLAAVVSALDLGSDASAAFAHFAGPTDPSAFVRARVALEFVYRHGAGAEALESVADSLRASVNLDGEVRALTAQARLSAQLLVALPIAFAGLGAMSGLDAARALVTTSAGRACLAAGLALDIAGAVWLSTQTRVSAT